MSFYQQREVLYQLVSILVIFATTAKAARWTVEVANPELTKGVHMHSSDDSEGPFVEKEDLAKSGTAWVRTYHKPPGTNVATIYNSDRSKTDNWDPVKNLQLSNSVAKETNHFSISKKPTTSIKYGTKSDIVPAATVSNVQLTNYQKIGSKETSYSTLVTPRETKDKNHKNVVWTPKNKDWSLKTTVVQDEQQVVSDYDSSSIQNNTTSTEQVAERRETNDKGSSVEYNDQSGTSSEVVEGNPQDWRVVDEDGTNGWKILGKKGNTEWEIKLENGSWIVKNQDGMFSHKVNLPTPLNDSVYNYENDYLTDYGSYYDDITYDIPGTKEIYLVPKYDNAWPKVTNIAVPEPWRPENLHSSQEFIGLWPQISNTTDKPSDQDGTTTQAPITEKRMMKTTIKPKLTTSTAKLGNDVTNVQRYYNLGKYYTENKVSSKSEFKKNPANEIIWTPLSEMSTPATADLNESIDSKPIILRSNKNNIVSRTNPSKKTIHGSNQDPNKTQGQWITGYGSQTWAAGTGKKEWDNENSTSDNLGNKVSAWGTGYGTKVWRGNEWDSNVVWKTGYGQGGWNSVNGTGTFVFPSTTYYGKEKTQGKGNYKGKKFFPGTRDLSTQSKKNKNFVVVNEDGSSDNTNHQDMSNNQQEEWGDEKSEGGVVWLKNMKLPVRGTNWKFPDDTTIDSVLNKKPKIKTNSAKSWSTKWSKTPITMNGPGWKPSIVLSDKNGWQPSGIDTGNWKIMEDNKQLTNPDIDQTSMEKPAKIFKPSKNENTAVGNTQNSKFDNSQYWKIGNYKDGSWELYRDYNPPKSNWKTTGKSWKPPVFVWPEYKQDIITTTTVPTSDLSEQMPTVSYSREPNPIYIKWRKQTPQNFKWPIATPVPEKWVKKWRKPTINAKPETTTTTTIPTTTTTTTVQTLATSSKPSSKFPEIKYIWPVKTFNAKSWKPLNVISSPDCKDKETTIPQTMPTTTMMETTSATTELPIITTSNNDDKDKLNLDHPPIIIIKKIPGFKNIKFSSKGKEKPKFRPYPPNFHEWGNYKGQPLKISGDVATGYYKGSPFKSTLPTKPRKQKKRVKVPKWIKSSYKGSTKPSKGWSITPNYAKWVASNPSMYQNLKPESYAKPKPTWKDTFKRFFG